MMATVPLVAWTYTALPVYVVWYRSTLGYRWIVPPSVMWAEFGIVAAVLAALIISSRRRPST